MSFKWGCVAAIPVLHQPTAWFGHFYFVTSQWALRGVLIIFNIFRSFYFVVIVLETFYDSLDIKELLRDIVEASLCELFNHVYNDLIVYLKDKLKNLDIPEEEKTLYQAQER